MSDKGSCEFCDRRTTCCNIYVALKILDSEIQYLDNKSFTAEYKQLLEEVNNRAYGYPSAEKSCSLAKDKDGAERLLDQLQKCLFRIRQLSKIS